MAPKVDGKKIGWVGAGRMGYAMAHRLLDGKVDMAVWNRTRDKAEPLAKEGAAIVDKPSDLAGRDIVFTVLATSKDFIQAAKIEALNSPALNSRNAYWPNGFRPAPPPRRPDISRGVRYRSRRRRPR